VIVGIGIELVETARFEAALERRGDRLRERLFTAAERCHESGRPRNAQGLAARFAAKLAAREALRSQHLPWHEIEVVRSAGAPSLRLHGRAARAARACGVADIALSLSHDASWCLSHVVLSGVEGSEGGRS
jgi:holo-[acyl-carrier protein] synthase